MKPQRIKVSDARKDLSEILSRVKFQGQRFILTKGGKDKVAVISIEEFTRLVKVINALKRYPHICNLLINLHS